MRIILTRATAKEEEVSVYARSHNLDPSSMPNLRTAVNLYAAVVDKVLAVPAIVSVGTQKLIDSLALADAEARNKKMI